MLKIIKIIILITIIFGSKAECFSQGAVSYFKSYKTNPIIELLDSMHFKQQTVEMWIQFNEIRDEYKIISDNFQYDLRLVRMNDSMFIHYSIFADNQWLTQTSKTSLPADTWHHIAGVFNGKNLFVYLNGKDVSSSEVKFKSNFELKSSIHNNIQFHGFIDEIRIWKTALSPDEVHYWRFIPIVSRHKKWNSLLAFLRCNDNIVPDNNGNVLSHHIFDSKSFSAHKTQVNDYVKMEYVIKQSFYKKSRYNSIQSSQNNSIPGPSAKSVAIYFNNSIIQLFNYENLEFKYGSLNNDDRIEITNSSSDFMHNDEVPFAMIKYKGDLIYGAYRYNTKVTIYKADLEHLYSRPFSDKFGEVDIRTKISPTLAILHDTLYLFYVATDGTLYADKTTDLKNWTRAAIIDRSLNSDHGGISAYKYRDTSGNETIYLAYVNKTLDSIILSRFYGDYVVTENSIHVKKLRNLSIVPGTVSCGFSNGYALQIFYSSDEANGSGCNKTIGRIEYSIEHQYAYQAEILDLCGHAEYENFGSQYQFQPYAFEYYHTYGEEKNLGKKIILSLYTHGNSTINIDYLVWDSDKMIYLPEEDTTDTNPDPRLSELLGVIEGPPPYVLNEDNIDSLASLELYPSMLEFGSSTSSEAEHSVAFDKNWIYNLMILGTSSETEGHAISITDSSTSQREYQNQVVFPTAGRPVGYKLFQRPVITRKKFMLTDGNGNFLDNIYTFNISQKFLDWVPYYLDTVPHSPNPGNFTSYINRSVDIDSYNKYYSKIYSWARGSENKIGLETDETITHKSEVEFYQSWGEDIAISMGYGEGVEVEAEVYHLETRCGSTSTVESTTSQSNSKSIELTTKCPFHGREHDTSHFAGTVYWLKPTQGKNNWWIPKGWESHNPWCITYKVNIFSLYGTDVKDNQDENSISIYPLPANDFIYITNNQNLFIRRIQIYNSLGQTVKEFDDNDFNFINKFELPLADLPSGLYYSKFYIDNTFLIKSFLIYR